MGRKTSLLKLLVFYWLPAFLWMGTIFYLSSRHSFKVANEYALNFAFFKCIHVIVYAGLFFMLFRAFYRTFPNGKVTQILLLAIVFSILYGVTDEIHQLFTPTREGTIRDVLIDTVGILLMFGYTKKYLSKLGALL